MKSKYEQFAELLEERIVSGDYQSRDFLPGERVLADDHGLSRNTVRNAIRLLRNKGLVEPMNGKGLQVVGDSRRAPKVLTRLIGGVFPRERGSTESSVELLSAGICDALSERDNHLVFTSSKDQIREEMCQIHAIMAKNVDGLLVMPTYRKMSSANRFDDVGNHERIKSLYDSGFPIVLVDRSYSEPGIPCVCNDDAAGGRMATEHLLSIGCRHVVYIGQTLYRVGKMRHQGYLEATRANGLKPISRHFNHLSSGELSKVDLVFEEMSSLLEQLSGTIGIVTQGPAARVLADIVGSGGKAFERLRWIGYDFSPDESKSNGVTFPWLRRPMYEIGKRAAEKVLSLIDGDEEAATEEFVAPELMNEES